MLEKYFSKKSKTRYYLPGQEIKIDRNTAFSSHIFDEDPLIVVKNRIAFTTLLFIFAYILQGIVSQVLKTTRFKAFSNPA